MEIRIYPRNPILRKYIDHFSFNVNIPHEGEFFPVVPDCMTELVINLGKPYERRKGDNAKPEKVNSSHFIGIKSRRHFIRTNSSTKTLCVRFKPGVMSLFTNHKIEDLTDEIIDAREIFSNEFRVTQEKIEDLNDVNKMIRETEGFLLKNLNMKHKGLQIVELINFIYLHPSLSRIDALKKRSGLDYKHLERSFKKYAGLHPKYLINIIKFNFAAKQMFEQPAKPLTQIALECGYYDQSHFIKAFRRFSGLCPKEYLPFNSPRASSNQVTINRQF